MASPLGAVSPTTDVDLDKVYGTIYGQCTGDAIGLLTEFMDKRRARKHYSPPLEYGMKVADRHRNSWRTGDWTDDSDQMILIMQALTRTRGNVNDDTLRIFCGDLYTWMLDGFRELGDKGGCGLGRTTGAVLTHPDFLDNPQKAAREVWEGTGQAAAPNGAVMRTSILGVQQFWDLDTVGENAKLFSLTTHADPRCIASCVAVTTAIAQMLQGETDMEKIIHESFRRASAHLSRDKHVAQLQWYMEPRELEELQLDAEGVIGYTYKALGAGFWALRQDNFRTAIERITMEAGDADTNAAVAGALLGCKLGWRSLPDSWVVKMPYKRWLDWQITKYLQAVGLAEVSRSLPHGRATGRDGDNRTSHYIKHERHGHTTEGPRHTGPSTHIPSTDTRQGKHEEKTTRTSQDRQLVGVHNTYGKKQTRSHSAGLADSVSIRLPQTEEHYHKGNQNRSGHAGSLHHQNPQWSSENPNISHKSGRSETHHDQKPHKPFSTQKPHNPDRTDDSEHFVTSYSAAYGQNQTSVSHSESPRGRHRHQESAGGAAVLTAHSREDVGRDLNRQGKEKGKHLLSNTKMHPH